MQFKYRINDYMEKLPGSISVNKIHYILEYYHGITKDVFAKDRFIEQGSNDEIPLHRLLTYSRVLAIPLENLVPGK